MLAVGSDHTQDLRGKRKQTTGNILGWRLSDLSEDIGEKNNLANKHPEVSRKRSVFLIAMR